MTRLLAIGKWIPGGLALLLAACASTTPEYAAESLQAQAVEHLSVLPVVDHRIDQSRKINFEKKYFTKMIKRRVKKAHYDFTLETDPAYIAAVTRDGLEDGDGEMISQLGPEGARWVLLLVLEDADAKLGLGGSGSGEATGYLFDKQDRRLVWRNKEIGEYSQRGVIGLAIGAAMPGGMQTEGAISAIDKVLKGLPKREKG